MKDAGCVCIIGAGACGLAAAKVLHERGISYDCFEMGSDLGGNWRYENDNGVSAAYWSLHINTSRDRMSFSDFPMPDDYPDFPHHTQVLRYFEGYVDHFGFRDRIIFRTEVVHVMPAPDDTFDVTLRDLETRNMRTERYAAVLVANGHHWCARWPDFPGTFDGTILHAHDYRTSDILRNQRVLVVGVGNSGCDIVCDAARVAARAFLSTRRGAHVIPKYLLGRPLDAWVTPLSARLPMRVQRFFTKWLVLLTRGTQDQYGFPTPEYPIGEEHPTVSSDLLNLVGHGRITIKPSIERVEGDRVHFVDGTEESVDVIVYATGYDVCFPFFDDDFVSVKGNRVTLFLHVIPPAIPNLYFIGLIQPLGAVMPLAEAQAEWVADLLEGNTSLPDRAAMERTIAKAEAAMQKRYTPSPRHTMQVDFYPYMAALRRARKPVKGR